MNENGFMCVYIHIYFNVSDFVALIVPLEKIRRWFIWKLNSVSFSLSMASGDEPTALKIHTCDPSDSVCHQITTYYTYILTLFFLSSNLTYLHNIPTSHVNTSSYTINTIKQNYWTTEGNLEGMRKESISVIPP
jgi:hypothetical protein